MQRMLIFLFLSVLWLVPEAIQAQQWSVTRSDLDRYAIDFFQFKPALFSTKGDMFIGYEFMDFESRKKGLVYGLRVFRFKPEGKFTIDTIPLPISFVVSMALTENDQTAIVVGNYGSKILKVNLRTSKVDTIFQFTPGKPGFRTENLVISWAGKVYLSGYFYDKEQYCLNEAIVELRYADPKPENLFYQTTNLTEVHKQIGGQPHIMYIVNGDVVYFAYTKPPRKLTTEEKKAGNNMYLYCWNKDKLIEIDRGTAVGNFAGTPDRVYYSIIKDRKTRGTYVKKLTDRKVWAIGEKDVPYTYPFISNDGKLVIFCTVSVLDQRMNVYFAKEQENFKTQQMIQETSVGPMKLSGDGKMYLLMTPDEIKVGPVISIQDALKPVEKE